jgi:hypothetical protein
MQIRHKKMYVNIDVVPKYMFIYIFIYIMYCNFVSVGITVKPVYVEHVDNWFLKLVLYYLNEYIFKNHLSTCST